MDAGRRVPDVANDDIATMYAAQAECWYRAAEFEKAADTMLRHADSVKGDPVEEAKLLLKRSRVEEKLGKYRGALRWAARARRTVNGLNDREAARQAAQAATLSARCCSTKVGNTMRCAGPGEG